MSNSKRLKDWSDSRGISQQEVSVNDWSAITPVLDTIHSSLKENGVQGYVLNKIEELVEYCEAMRDGDENGAVDAIADSSVFDATELVKMGYDIDKTMNEVLMVVESRTGQWDESLGKFIKDGSPEYEPDYVKNCKLIEERTTSLFGHGSL